MRPAVRSAARDGASENFRKRPIGGGRLSGDAWPGRELRGPMVRAVGHLAPADPQIARLRLVGQDRGGVGRGECASGGEPCRCGASGRRRYTEGGMTAENFFDFRARLVARPPRVGGNAAVRSDPGEAMTVGQLTGVIERAIKTGVPPSVLVKGEVSNVNIHRSSGHIYFTMKDAAACLDCVIFKSDAARMRFKPTDGAEMLAGGRVAVYAQRGRYQLYVTSIQPLGKGALEAAFQELRRKLAAEGLFDPRMKLPLPAFPINVAIVTSAQGAALQDILKVLQRYPFLKLMLYHVPVQGEGAAEKIVGAIAHLNRMRSAEPPVGSESQRRRQAAVDVILLSRGGGSLEDLWEFNEECVARAIAASEIPIVTGIGHEVDTSIADLVADVHAHTPTEAAQVVTTHWKTARDSIDVLAVRLRRGLRSVVQEARHRLTAVERHEVFRRPLDRINQLRQVLDDRQRSLALATSHRLRGATARVERTGARLLECHPRHRLGLHRAKLDALDARLTRGMSRDQERRARLLDALQAQLNALSPKAVLRRGYTMTTRKKDQAVIRSAAALKPGDRIVTHFADGVAESTVEDQQQLPLFE
jgi:exodeoxyribonuclease VII large subunit